MLNELPDEIITMIINKSCSRPSDYLCLCNINKRFLSIINNYRDLYDNKTSDYEEDINNVCLRKTNIKTFDWLFKNKVKLTLENIKYLIIHNRYDVLKRGLLCKDFVNVLFNRFYIHIENPSTYDIFSFIEIKNPLLIAGIHNRIEIIKLLLENNDKTNPYLNMISNLLDISIKYSHKNLLSYLIIFHFHLIKENIQRKLNTIIYRINNCEDILFHLMINKQITLTPKHFYGIISMEYNSFFETYYDKLENNNACLGLLGECIDTNNIVIFNYIIQRNQKLSSNEFTKMVFTNRRKVQKDFIYNLINNYIDLFELDCPLINICILNDIESDLIIDLIQKNYLFNEEDMKIVLEKKDIYLLEKMCLKLLTS
tara:strand:+ start:383 stop:1492 length:1110 start_codon:yes stop_codon:yes gene_type:complete